MPQYPLKVDLTKQCLLPFPFAAPFRSPQTGPSRQTLDNLCAASPTHQSPAVVTATHNRFHRQSRRKEGGNKEKEIFPNLQVFSKWHSEVPSTRRFLLLIRIIYFCLAPRGLAVRGSERDGLHQGLGSLSPRGRGERTCGDRDRAELR